MNIAFKIMAFSIMMNIATGMMMDAIPIYKYHDNSSLLRGNLNYDSIYDDTFTSALEGEVNPSGVMEDKGNLIYRVLDMINLGFVYKILSTIMEYLFGFINMLKNILGPYIMEDLPGLYAFLFGIGATAGKGILYVVMSIVYIYAGIYLWTGKDLFQ